MPQTTETPLLVNDGRGLDAAGLVHRVWQRSTAPSQPTVVMVHGRSGNEDVMWIFARTLPADWLVVAPRAFKTDPRGGYSWDVRPDGEWPTVDDLAPGAEALSRFIDALPELYNADPAHTYLMGFSQGAGTILTLLMRPDQLQARIRGVAALVGFMPQGAQPDELAHFADLPVFMAVGRRDPAIPLDIAQTCAHQLIDGGARLDYRAYNTGHKLSTAGLNDLKAWWASRAAQDFDA